MHARNPVGMNWCGHITDKALSWRNSVERSQISFDHAHLTASIFLGFPIQYIGQDGPTNFRNATIRRSTASREDTDAAFIPCHLWSCSCLWCTTASESYQTKRHSFIRMPCVKPSARLQIGVPPPKSQRLWPAGRRSHPFHAPVYPQLGDPAQQPRKPPDPFTSYAILLRIHEGKR